jgi:hypothetical protein
MCWVRQEREMLTKTVRRLARGRRRPMARALKDCTVLSL